MPNTDPRRLALDVIQPVIHQGAGLEESFAGHPRLAALSSRDRAFARHLVATTLRRLGEIDAVLDAFLERPLTGKRARGQDLLRLGAAQLLFLDTPPHAAVATSVTLARAVGLEGLAGLVNAVLRRVAQEGKARLAALDVDRLTLPAWLWDRLVAACGEPAVRALAAVQRQEPPLDLSLRRPEEAAEWAERLGATVLPGNSLRLQAGSGEIRRLAGYDEGAWWVQDVAAALPVRLLAPQAGETIADLCAAPGGKTLQLAAAGAETFAIELHARRLALIQDNLRRTGLSAACVQGDAATWKPPQPLDAVLLDAPCSATGTLRRHPDVALHRNERELNALTKLQSRLLAHAVKQLRPGGRLIYAVCSLLPEEGPERIAALLSSGAPLAVEPAAPQDFGLPAEAASPEGGLRTLPGFWAERGGMDGFYTCRLRRL
ncbi:RsmB/NOP family class I SAM-dependent RNA methyltransferase [Aquibaculum sediminis]|uniref:RsmB/NOP family class I SAM-dependent RNA methyltransferase n=1 Tax=Aquibaculum sediminis TaxID=3231907 RepID=UPI0034548585